MKMLFNPAILASLLFFAFASEKYVTDKQEEYVCLPCGADCDRDIHKGLGTCRHCNMALVKKSTIKHNDIDPAGLCSFITKAGTGNVLLLDVRTAAEFEGRSGEKYGRLNNAVNIPIQELETRMKELNG